MASPGSVGAAAAAGAVEGADGEPNWLDDRESRAWRALIHLVTVLPQALDRQLRDDAGIGHVYYMILALVSEAPEQRLRLSDLAAATGTSLSRLSHALDALEVRGWITRCPAPEGQRGAVARLTDEGRRLLERVAPGHVAEVRRLVLDPLTPDEVEQLGRLAGRVLEQVQGAGRAAARTSGASRANS